jgi:hypothetical protein
MLPQPQLKNTLVNRLSPKPEMLQNTFARGILLPMLLLSVKFDDVKSPIPIFYR